MATQAWPVGLPTSPKYGSYRETPEPQVGEFQPDVGDPSRWPRAAVPLLACSWSLDITAAQRLTLLGFWAITCSQGKFPFTLADPIVGTPYTWKWVSAPDIQAVIGKTNFLATIKVRRWMT